MSNELLEYIGSQIKMFRKIKKLTIEELAKMINKSKSTVSKYESGEIAIDIVTLFDISRALNINIVNLIDYEDEKDTDTDQTYFWETRHLYMYHQIGKKIYCSLLKLRKEESSNKALATLYFNVSDINNPNSCECVYQGKMNLYNNILNFNLTNCLYDSESVLINFFIPMKKVTFAVGLISGLEGISLRPTSYKVVLSKDPLPDEKQRELLQISKDVIKKLKNEHVFRIDD